MHKILRVIPLAFACTAFVGTTYGQQPDPKARWTPPQSIDETQVSLRDIFVAKMAADRSSVMLMLPQYRTETRSRVVSVTKMRTETRTRSKEVAGQTVTEEYPVQVPYTEQVEQSYTVTFSVGTERINVPFTELKAFDLSAVPIESTSLASRLVNATHVFVQRNGAEFKAIDPFTASVLRPDVIVLQIAPEVISKYSKSANPPAPVPIDVPAVPAVRAPVIAPDA
jgi:hypothetical protein